VSLPVDLSVIVVTGTFLQGDGTPCIGSVTFSSNQEISNQNDHTFVSIGSRTAELDANGHFALPLPAGNDPDWSPVGWTYTVTVNVTNRSVARTPYAVLVPFNAPGGTIDLTALAPIPPVVLPNIYVLQSAVGADNGVASLDGNGNVPLSELGNVASTINPFAGKNWTAIGTSITHQGNWTGPLNTILQPASLTNLGITGSVLSNGITSNVAFFGLGDGFNEIFSIPANTDFITMEFGVNDFRTSIRLGSFSDKDISTFYGALWQTMLLIQTFRPNALLYILTPYGFTDTTFSGTWGTANGFGYYLKDYQKAIHDVAAVFSVPVIEVGEQSTIGIQTDAEYLSDGLHPTVAGGIVYANYVAPRIKALFTSWPPVVSTPNFPTQPIWSATNLIANGDFETVVTSWFFQAGASFVGPSTTDFVTGTHCALFTTVAAATNPGATAFGITTGVVVGKTYQARGFAKIPAASYPAWGPATCTMKCNFSDAGSNTLLQVTSTHAMLVNQWTEFDTVGVAPVGTTQILVQLTFNGATPAGFSMPMDAWSVKVATNL
jgi:lysophospholipase L1-like esterase